MKLLKLRGKAKELPLSYHCLGGYREKKDQEETKDALNKESEVTKPSRAEKRLLEV